MYSTPDGIFSNNELKEGKSKYDFKLVAHWCRDPNKIITKTALLTYKQFNKKELPESWIGKTRKEVGFFPLSRDGVSQIVDV